MPLPEAQFCEALRALGHVDRLDFVRECLKDEKAAGELAARSTLSLATVSEHLKVLRKSGMLRLNRDGRFWRYRTDQATLTAVGKAILELGEL